MTKIDEATIKRLTEPAQKIDMLLFVTGSLFALSESLKAIRALAGGDASGAAEAVEKADNLIEELSQYVDQMKQTGEIDIAD